MKKLALKTQYRLVLPLHLKAWSYVQEHANARLCLWRTRADPPFVVHTHRLPVIRPGCMLRLAFEIPEHEERRLWNPAPPDPQLR